MKITGKDYIEYTLRELNIPFEKEFKFIKDRKFRADFYVKELNLLLEYDGIMSAKSRHTSITGFSKDTEKTNLACLHGYKLLRYTILTYKNFYNDIKYLIQNK